MTSDLQEPLIFKLLSFLGTFSTRTDQSDVQMIHSSVLDMFLEDLRKTPPSGRIGGMTISISLSSKEKGYHLLDPKEGSINRMRRTTVYSLSRNEQEKVMSQRKENTIKSSPLWRWEVITELFSISIAFFTLLVHFGGKRNKMEEENEKKFSHWWDGLIRWTPSLHFAFFF